MKWQYNISLTGKDYKCPTFSGSRDFLGQACNDTTCCIMLVESMWQFCTNDTESLSFGLSFPSALYNQKRQKQNCTAQHKHFKTENETDHCSKCQICAGFFVVANLMCNKAVAYSKEKLQPHQNTETKHLELFYHSNWKISHTIHIGI